MPISDDDTSQIVDGYDNTVFYLQMIRSKPIILMLLVRVSKAELSCGVTIRRFSNNEYITPNFLIFVSENTSRD